MNRYQRESSLKINSLIIIDALGENDLQTARRLEENLMYAGLAVERISLNQLGQLIKLLDEIAKLIKQYDHFSPIIHFEGHGSEDKFYLSIDSYIDWSDLYTYLSNINEASKNNTIIFMACCYGFNFIKKNLTLKNYSPCSYLVGLTNEIYDKEIVESTSLFYKVLLDKNDIDIAISQLSKYSYETYIAEMFFVKSMARYFLNGHFGKGKKERVEKLITMFFEDKNINESEKNDMLGDVRDNAKKFLNDRNKMEEIYHRYGEIFLGSQYPKSFEKLLDFIGH